MKLKKLLNLVYDEGYYNGEYRDEPRFYEVWEAFKDIKIDCEPFSERDIDNLRYHSGNDYVQYGAIRYCNESFPLYKVESKFDIDNLRCEVFVNNTLIYTFISAGRANNFALQLNEAVKNPIHKITISNEGKHIISINSKKVFVTDDIDMAQLIYSKLIEVLK